MSRWDEARARCDAADADRSRFGPGVSTASVDLRPDLRAALDAIDAVVALHRGCDECRAFFDGPETTHCIECEKPWPCPTAAALGAE